MLSVTHCSVCNADARFLRTTRRPDYEAPTPAIRIVDLFAGGGGLSLGLAEAARRIGVGAAVVLAVERDDDVADVFTLNFPSANLVRSDVCDIFDGDLRARLTSSERRVRREIGDVDVLLAGPPCQGHSDLNNHTRRRDPRNALYLRAVRAVEILRPRLVVLENVPAIERDATSVVDEATTALTEARYAVASAVLDLTAFGVPQSRRRHILLASRLDGVDPAVVLSELPSCAAHKARTIEWAIGDLATIAVDTGVDAPSAAARVNRERMQWLIDNDKYDLPNELRPECHHGFHSYVSMYGRLRWDAPAQTITTGFGSMGQGRFVHPSLPRTITPHEAARLQTLPDFFALDPEKGRGAWATVIGNAVPPLLVVHLTEPLLQALPTVAEADSQRGTARAETGRLASTGRRMSRKGTPSASSELIRTRMSTTKQRDTGPELALRSELHRLGLRYFVDRPIDGTRRRADIVFPGPRVAVYVDGCFWHSCPAHGTVPKENRDWWIAKLKANRRRDEDTDARLHAAGWIVLRFWEHEAPTTAADVVLKSVRSRTAGHRDTSTRVRRPRPRGDRSA
jgi:DNA (cytosine-5)-methyltransferase 1